jgi:hypothetical protein
VQQKGTSWKLGDAYVGETPGEHEQNAITDEEF